MLYDVLLADPWRDEGTTLADAIALPVTDLVADDAVMFMWSGGMAKLLRVAGAARGLGLRLSLATLSWQRTRQGDDDPLRPRAARAGADRQARESEALPAERDRPPSTIDGSGTASRRAPRHHPVQIIERMLLPARQASRRAPVRRPCRARIATHWHVWDAQPKGNQKAA